MDLCVETQNNPALILPAASVFPTERYTLFQRIMRDSWRESVCLTKSVKSHVDMGERCDCRHDCQPLEGLWQFATLKACSKVFPTAARRWKQDGRNAAAEAANTKEKFNFQFDVSFNIASADGKYVCKMLDYISLVPYHLLWWLRLN